MEHESQPNSTIWFLIVLVLAVFAGALIYFGKNNPSLANQGQITVPESTTRKPRLYTVSYNFGVFSPTNIRIRAGDSVKFQNDSKIPVHIISDSTGGIADLPGFDSTVEVPPGSSFAFTFDKAGIFGYHNAKNADESGTVIVRP